MRAPRASKFYRRYFYRRCRNPPRSLVMEAKEHRTEAEMVKDTIANTVLAALLWALGQYLGVEYAESLVMVLAYPLERRFPNLTRMVGCARFA